jgi:hypothetical protein
MLWLPILFTIYLYTIHYTVTNHTQQPVLNKQYCGADTAPDAASVQYSNLFLKKDKLFLCSELGCPAKLIPIRNNQNWF